MFGIEDDCCECEMCNRTFPKKEKRDLGRAALVLAVVSAAALTALALYWL